MSETVMLLENPPADGQAGKKRSFWALLFGARDEYDGPRPPATGDFIRSKPAKEIFSQSE